MNAGDEGNYGRVLSRDDDSVWRVALDLEVSDRRKRGQQKTMKKQVEEGMEKIGLKEDVLYQVKWRDGAQIIAGRMM